MQPVIIYRPPPLKKKKYSYADFRVEFTGFIGHYALMTIRFAIFGDFNIHWDVPSHSNVKHFANLLESLNIAQHVHAPTHIDSHTTDLIHPQITALLRQKQRCCSPTTCGWHML